MRLKDLLLPALLLVCGVFSAPPVVAADSGDTGETTNDQAAADARQSGQTESNRESFESVSVFNPSDSMRFGDLHFGNGLDPSGWGWLYPDRRGFSWLHPHMLRTPSGKLYPYPPKLADGKPPLATTEPPGEWQYWGIVQIGYLVTGGDTQAQFFRQYTDWQQGPILGILALFARRPSTGDYFELRGSWLSPDDNYLTVTAGRRGEFQVQAFHHSMPHMVASNAYPLWHGVGSTELTLPDPLEPGESTVPQIEAAARAADREPVRLVRTRNGLSIEGQLFDDWIGFASFTIEQREGTRLWGGTMFFNYPFPDNGGIMETVRPIDFTTIDVDFALRYNGETWRFSATYTGSFFRNHKDYVNYDSPFDLWNVVGTEPVGNIYDGEFSLEPDNNYHNLKLELGRALPWRGSLSIAAAVGTMRQDDRLRPWVTCTGRAGVFISPQLDFTFDCSDWNTVKSLPRDSAEARIDTALFYARAVFRPSTDFGWRAELRWYQENNKTNWVSYNPITGQYGYIAENGAQGTIVPAEIYIFDPNNPLFQSINLHYRNIPFEYAKASFELGANWRINPDNTLDVSYRFENKHPEHRERDRVYEHRITIAWVNRSLGQGTLRVSLEHARRRGDEYRYDPYGQYYTESLPGFVMPPAGLHALTTSAMRKYDISDLDQTKLHAILIYPIGNTGTLSATVYGDNQDHDTLIGRQQFTNYGFTLQWQWQPAPDTSLNAWLGMSKTETDMANVEDAPVLGTPAQQNPTFGGPLYPFSNAWTATDSDRNQQFGITFFHNFGWARLDASYDWVRSRTELHYRHATRGAGAFPDIRYRRTTVDLGLSFDINNNVGMRVFGRRISGSFHDWHYAGLEHNPVIDHRIYTDRGPREHYAAWVVGVLFSVSL